MILSQSLQDLKQSLWDYFGQLNEISAGITIKPEDRLPKPEALVRYDQAKEFGIPYIDGGLLDQPYLWMMEHGVISSFMVEWQAVQRVQQQTKQ